MPGVSDDAAVVFQCALPLFKPLPPSLFLYLWHPLTSHACDRASIMGWYECYTELAGLMSDRHRVGDLFA